jgi:hypothetical protein
MGPKILFLVLQKLRLVNFEPLMYGTLRILSFSNHLKTNSVIVCVR